MAKNYSEIYTAVYDKGNSMSFGNAMLRGNGVPLDITEVYNSYEAAVLYAAENAVAYEGQLLAVTENGDTTVYVITPAVQGNIVVEADGTGDGREVPVYIKEVGSMPEADGNTITIVDGKLTLVGLDKATDGEKKYQPVLVDGKLTWQELSATTVEGLDAAIKAVEGEVDTLQTTVGNEEAGLVKDVADNTTNIASNAAAISANTQLINDLETAYKAADEALDKKISDAVAEVKKYADDNDADTAYDDTQVKADITTNANAIAGVKATAEQAAADITAMEEAYKAADAEVVSDLKTYVGEQIALQSHFSTKVVTSTSEMTDPTTLYLIKDGDAVGDDVYKEYMLIEGTPVIIGSTSTDLTDYYTKSEVDDEVQTAKDAAESAVESLAETLRAEIEDVSGAVNTVSEALEAHETAADAKYETKEAVAESIKTVQDAVDELTETVGTKADTETVESEIARVEELANGAQTSADTNAQAISALQTADTELAARVKTLEDVESEKNVINSVSDEFTVDENRKLNINIIGTDKVSGLDAALETLQETDDRKVDKIEGWTLLSPDDQEKLAKLTVGETGNLEVSGSVNADNVKGLDTWVTGKRDSLAGLFSNSNETKLAGIASGAQVNVIESVKIAGSAVTISADKSVNIPYASNDTIGVVLGSNAENKIRVDVDGTMEVNSLNVNKLIQTDGDTLVLNGGSSIA